MQTTSKVSSFSWNQQCAKKVVPDSPDSLHFTQSLHFTPGPQSAVCSPQSAFYTDRFIFSLYGLFSQFRSRDVLKGICLLCFH